ncbi:MAG: 2,3-bisphosphoglycerate-independent phosphoglycerate mutase [Candidatus Bathyarchaeota archaeon]|nr:2,3-bisphosphoglycerate-independent phosphoglycerate mutase [Candidatus Termiticorpusculum sp.]
MADQPLQKLNFKTPLEVASCQSMNKLAHIGASGLLDPIAPGIAPGSDAANLTLLGYNPWLVCKGRGPFEAAGAGLQLKHDDLAFRCNFATVDDNLCLVDERAGRIGAEAKALGETIEQIQLKVNSDVEVHFKQALGFKAALVLRGDKLSSKVTTILPKVGTPVVAITPLDNSFEAKHTADVLNEFIQLTNQTLKQHPINTKRRANNQRPANAVLPWSGSKKPEMASFQEKYGLRATCVAAASLIKGIGKFSGMDVPDVQGATGELDTDTLAKADAALTALENGNDFVYVHVEAPDEASHDGDVMGKIAIIQKIDALVGRILNKVNLADTVVILVPDHATSCKTRAHTGDAVPVCFAGINVISDGVNIYSERSAYKGGLNRISGKDIMPMALNYMGKPEKLSW